MERLVPGCVVEMIKFFVNLRPSQSLNTACLCECSSDLIVVVPSVESAITQLHNEGAIRDTGYKNSSGSQHLYCCSGKIEGDQ